MIAHMFTLLFVALKLLGVIDWSWWFVLLPSYAGFALAFVLVVIGGTLKFASH